MRGVSTENTEVVGLAAVALAVVEGLRRQRLGQRLDVLKEVVACALG